MTKVLVSDPIDQLGIDILSQVAQVDVRTGLAPEELQQIIGDYDALMIRSGTQVTAPLIEAASRLKIIGRAGVGVDNVDVPTATKHGVIVVNSPEGNTIAAAEHALAMMLALSRHIPAAHSNTASGGWNRKAYVGNELYKKCLGVVGLGKIGSHVARVAQAMGMEVMAYDPFISSDRAQQLRVRLSSLESLFKEADYITLHLPRTPDTENLVNRAADDSGGKWDVVTINPAMICGPILFKSQYGQWIEQIGRLAGNLEPSWPSKYDFHYDIIDGKE